MRTLKTIIVLLLFVSIAFSVSAIVDYIGTPTPADNSEEINFSSNVTTCIVVDKLSGCTLDIFFYENSSGSWVEYQNYTTVSGGQSYCGNFSVVCGTTYYWKVSSHIDCGQSVWWENHTYSFTTIDCPVSHISPVNGSDTDCPCCMAICAKMSNLTGDTIKFAFQSNYTGVWSTLEESRTAPSNTTYCICVPEFVWYNYTYYWRIVYNIGSGTEYSDVYHFTTESNIDNCPCGETGGGDIVFYPDFGIVGLFGILGLVGLIILNKRR
jgi:hypothetical protein